MQLTEEDELLPLLFAPTGLRRAFKRLRMDTYEDLCRKRGRDLFDVEGIGSKGWDWIQRVLEERHLTLLCGWPHSAPRCQPPMQRVIIEPEATNQGVYFIRGAGLVKIGISDCVVTRIRELQLMGPAPLEPLGFIPVEHRQELTQIERQLHRQFAADRSHGEWFKETLALAQHIAQEAHPWPERVTR